MRSPPGHYGGCSTRGRADPPGVITLTDVTLFAHAGDTESVPALTLVRVFTAWTFDPIALAGIAVAAGLYLAGVWVLWRRGDRWSVWRSLSFCLGGLGTLVIATCASCGTYDDVLLSMHMVQHMILSMVSPVFLALGAPITLALRTFRPRPRRWLLAVLHSKIARALTFPPVAFGLFVLSPWVLYLSSWYGATLRSPALHDLMHVHLLVVGCIFFWPLLGLDPIPGRVAYPFRMLMAFATLPFHAFLGVTIMEMKDAIAGDWYYGLHRSWGPSVMQDQSVAGGILWASGDVVGLIFFGVMFVQWVRQSMREAERVDRRLDREEAAALNAVHADVEASDHAPGVGR